MQNNDFEYGFGPALASEPEPEEKQASPKKRGRQTKAGSDEKVSYNLINCISVALRWHRFKEVFKIEIVEILENNRLKSQDKILWQP